MDGRGSVGIEMSRPARYEEIEALPANQIGQIIAGELVALPRPSGEHTLATDGLRFLLGGPLQHAPGGSWWIMSEREIHLGDDVVVPDLAGWRKERLARPAGPFETLPPDWLCEVLSPSTARLDRFAKMRIWAREGVGHVWLVDPLERSLEAYRLDGSQWVREGAWLEEERLRAEPFSEVAVDLAQLWPPAAGGAK